MTHCAGASSTAPGQTEGEGSRTIAGSIGIDCVVPPTYLKWATMFVLLLFVVVENGAYVSFFRNNIFTTESSSF